jgi:hypothetical protein
MSLVRAGDDMKDIGNQKLDGFMALDIVTKKHELDEISETASKEFGNLNSMKNMKETWASGGS